MLVSDKDYNIHMALPKTEKQLGFYTNLIFEIWGLKTERFFWFIDQVF
jgi:hypothetical protein